MSHLPLSPPEASTSLISTLADLVTITGGLLAIGVAVWQFHLYRQLASNQRAIETKQAEIDAIPDKVHGKANHSSSPIAQPARDRIIAAEQTPLKHAIELLERDREFLKDKLLFGKK